MESFQLNLSEVWRGDDDRGDGVRTEHFQVLLEDIGLDLKVAEKLDDIFKTGKLAYCDLDERAIEALKEIHIEGALAVLNQFLESNLDHVNNKSAFLCGIMKSFRQKAKAIRNGMSAESLKNTPKINGPNAEAINRILIRTGYELDVTMGQRKFYMPNSENLIRNSCEVFCGRIPKEIYEDELVVLFEKCGTILDLRLMMDPMTSMNRGYAFITFSDIKAARNAEDSFNNYEIRPNKFLKVTISTPNKRIFVGNIPKLKSKDEIFEEFKKLTTGLQDVIVYNSPNENKFNRGFCFLEYDTHKNASLAKRRLGMNRVKVWSCDIIVDWADPLEQPDEEIMNQVKVLFVRNIVQNVTEQQLKEKFECFGAIERVKKIKDFAFIHFQHRENAILAMQSLNGVEMGGSAIEIMLAKPPTDKKKKEDILRARERRMHFIIKNRSNSQLSFQLTPNNHSYDDDKRIALLSKSLSLISYPRYAKITHSLQFK